MIVVMILKKHKLFIGNEMSRIFVFHRIVGAPLTAKYEIKGRRRRMSKGFVYFI